MDSAKQLLENAKQLLDLAKDVTKSMEVAEKSMSEMVNAVDPQDRPYFNQTLSHINALLQDAKKGGNLSEITGKLNSMLHTQLEIKKNGGKGTK